MATVFRFNHYTLSPGPTRHRRRSSTRYQPWSFERRTVDLLNYVNARKGDRFLSFSQNTYARSTCRPSKDILPTRISTDVKEDVYQVTNLIEERLQCHKSNFMATQDICALMWAQILEEAIPILRAKIEEAAALEGLRDLEMSEAPPLTQWDDDGDFIMDL